MTWYDWLILILPVCFVMYMGFYTRRYVRGVSDFLSAGRLCGRYVISMGDVANSLSIIGLVGYIEMRYKTGFSVGFWSSVLAPLWIVLGLTGYIAYRFRETRAMSLGQFLEMRYSRRFRIVAAGLRSLAEMLANMIMPAIAARFFIQMLDLPQTYHVLGLELSTYVSLMILFLTLAISLICFGGTLALVITDTIQGMILYPAIACFVVFLFWKFSVGGEIMPVMADRVAGESFINPYDISKLRDFNLFTVVIVAVYATVMNRANWIGAGYSSAAKSPQEQKMAGLLGNWRNAIINVFYVLIAAALIAFLNHKHFASEANAVRKDLAVRVADAVFKNTADDPSNADPHLREVVKAAVADVPAQVHEIGVDPPLSQDRNLDTAFLDVIHGALKDDARERKTAELDAAGVVGEAREKALIDAEGKANDAFQQCRTLYYQQNLSVTMRALLPPGLFGLFALLLFLAMLSTDDTRIYSAALTLAQDVVLPLKKKPFTPRGHLWMIRIVSICIGVFFLAGSYWMKQMDYYNMFVVLVCAMWEGGAGAIMTFGLYTRVGTTAGAWTALVTSVSLSVSYVFVQLKWAETVYPAIAKAGLVESFDRALRWLSSPFEPYIHHPVPRRLAAHVPQAVQPRPHAAPRQVRPRREARDQAEVDAAHGVLQPHRHHAGVHEGRQGDRLGRLPLQLRVRLRPGLRGRRRVERHPPVAGQMVVLVLRHPVLRHPVHSGVLHHGVVRRGRLLRTAAALPRPRRPQGHQRPGRRPRRGQHVPRRQGRAREGRRGLPSPALPFRGAGLTV